MINYYISAYKRSIFQFFAAKDKSTCFLLRYFKNIIELFKSNSVHFLTQVPLSQLNDLL